MSMMSEIHAAMTESGEVARVEKLQARVTELDGQIATESDPAWRGAFRRARRLALQDIEHVMGMYALRLARVGAVV